MRWLRKLLLAGLLIWLPLVATYVVISFLVGLFDQVVLLLPKAYQPENLIGHNIPGLGLLISFVTVLFTGVLAANFLGNRLVSWWEGLLGHIPVVRTIYSGTKQIIQALAGGGQSFQKAFLLEYPRRGIWTVVFQTSTQCGEAQTKIPHDQVVNVFVPTSPNPTSGFFLMVPATDLQELEMSVDDALKMVISGGVMVPKYAKCMEGIPTSNIQSSAATLVKASPPEHP